MTLSDIKKAEILRLTAEGKTTSEVAEMVGCKEEQVSYIKKLNPQKDIVVTVSVEGPKWDRWAGNYFLVRCQTKGGLTVRICRAETDGNRRTQNARMMEIQKEFAAVLIGREIEFSTRSEPEHHRLDYHAKYAKLPDKLKALVPDYFDRIHTRSYDPDDEMLLEGAFTDDERQCFSRSERAAMLGIGR